MCTIYNTCFLISSVLLLTFVTCIASDVFHFLCKNKKNALKKIWTAVSLNFKQGDVAVNYIAVGIQNIKSNGVCGVSTSKVYIKPAERNTTSRLICYAESYELFKLLAVIVEANVMSNDRVHLFHTPWTTWAKWSP